MMEGSYDACQNSFLSLDLAFLVRTVSLEKILWLTIGAIALMFVVCPRNAMASPVIVFDIRTTRRAFSILYFTPGDVKILELAADSINRLWTICPHRTGWG